MTNLWPVSPRRRENSQINKIRNERGEITTDITEIPKAIREHYEQLYANIFDNLEEMDNFWEIQSPPKLNQEEIDNLNRQITRSEIESVIKKKKIPTNKSPGPDGVIGKFYLTYKEELMLILLKLFQKIKKEGRKEHSQRHSLKPSSRWYQNQRHYQKTKLQANSFDEYRCKYFQLNISKPNPTTHKNDHILQPSWIYPRVTRMVQHMQIKQCDTPHHEKIKTTWSSQ